MWRGTGWGVQRDACRGAERCMAGHMEGHTEGFTEDCNEGHVEGMEGCAEQCKEGCVEGCAEGHVTRVPWRVMEQECHGGATE